MAPVKKRTLISYLPRMVVRGLFDYIVPMQELPSEPIVVNPNELRVWMIGHATTFINLFGTTIITDPVLVNALPFPRRVTAHGHDTDELPSIDYVVVSHAHLDHCNKPTLRRLAPKTNTIILPRGCSDIVEGMGFKHIVELDWGQTFSETGVTIMSYRPEHWGKRYPWERRDRGYNCYTFEKNSRTVFFGGDTGYGEFFKKIGNEHRIDVALLPIGAYSPNTLSQRHHMNPTEAHQAFLDLKSEHCVPIHWGSFRLGLEPMSEPPRLFTTFAKELGVADRVHLLFNGESEVFTSASPQSHA